MKKLANFQLKNNKITAFSAFIAVFVMGDPVYAQKTLTTAKTALETLRDDLIAHIIPVAAAVILLCLAIGYAGRYIEKDTFVRWAVGVIIAGSATQLAKLLFTGA